MLEARARSWRLPRATMRLAARWGSLKSTAHIRKSVVRGLEGRGRKERCTHQEERGEGRRRSWKAMEGWRCGEMWGDAHTCTHGEEFGAVLQHHPHSAVRPN